MITIRDIQAAIADAIAADPKARDQIATDLQSVIAFQPLPSWTPDQLYGGIARRVSTVSQTS